MKNIVLGIVGTCVILYTFLIGLDILIFQTSKNEMEKHVSRIVENVLETEFQTGEAETVRQKLIEEITSSISKKGSLQVEFQAIDLEKGLLSVKVRKQLRLFNGKQREIVVEKTAIIERAFVRTLETQSSLPLVFQPEYKKMAVYDSADAFYQAYANEMKFLPGTNNQGEIYYATKAKKDVNTGIKYTTLGWKIRIFNKEGALVDTLYYKLGGTNMKTVDVCTIDGYEYCLYRVTLTNMRERMSYAGLQALNHPDCCIVFDACTTTKLNGVLQGGMTDEGPSWGSVYTTYNGIVNAQKWTEETKETLKSYYNKTVAGLFCDVVLERGDGIRQVTGAGKYCFGTTVTVSAEAEEGYHFKNWTGSYTSADNRFYFVIYASDVHLTANAEENPYHMDTLTGKVRFISKKYFKDEKENLISESMGGLDSDSIWRLDETYRALLEQLFQ